jgi:hypothetical protein
VTNSCGNEEFFSLIFGKLCWKKIMSGVFYHNFMPAATMKHSQKQNLGAQIKTFCEITYFPRAK